MIYLLIILAVWRVTHLITNESGPFDIFEKIRYGKLLNCFYCLSFWISIFPSFYYSKTFIDFIINCLAFSGGAIILEKVTDRYV